MSLRKRKSWRRSWKRKKRRSWKNWSRLMKKERMTTAWLGGKSEVNHFHQSIPTVTPITSLQLRPPQIPPNDTHLKIILTSPHPQQKIMFNSPHPHLRTIPNSLLPQHEIIPNSPLRQQQLPPHLRPLRSLRPPTQISKPLRHLPLIRLQIHIPQFVELYNFIQSHPYSQLQVLHHHLFHHLYIRRNKETLFPLSHLLPSTLLLISQILRSTLNDGQNLYHYHRAIIGKYQNCGRFLTKKFRKNLLDHHRLLLDWNLIEEE